MLLEQERKLVVIHCRKLASLTPGTSGNISIKSQDGQHLAISPSSMEYHELTAEDIVVVDMDGSVVDGGKRPSSELSMHLGCHRRQDIGAVVHTHSPAATTLAALGMDLPAVHYMLATSGLEVIRCAPFEIFGTPELAEAGVKYMGTGYASLLANHGVLAAGPNIGHAYSLAEQIEFAADIYIRSQALGKPNILTKKQLDDTVANLMSLCAPQ